MSVFILCVGGHRVRHIRPGRGIAVSFTLYKVVILCCLGDIEAVRSMASYLTKGDVVVHLKMVLVLSICLTTSASQILQAQELCLLY